MADMKKNTSHTIRRAQRFPVILIGEGLLVGIVGGLIVLFVPGGVKLCGRLAACDFILYKRKTDLDRRMVSGFGLAGGGRRKVGEMGTDDLGKRNPAGGGRSEPESCGRTGKKSASWRNFIGGFLCLFGGLSLGREGPSIQLGAMTGQGISRIRGSWEDRRTLSDDMRSKRRAGGGVSCAACRRDVCDRGDP